MGNNPSVKQFKTDILNWTKNVKYSFHQQLLAEADELVENIQNAIQHNVTGRLKASVRKRDISKNDQYSVLVIAGGPLTTTSSKAGSFDHALSTEFGTVNEEPRPFFYPTARLYEQRGLDLFKETLEQSIEENNKVRELRAQNYSNHGLTVSSTGRGGAVVINKSKI